MYKQGDIIAVHYPLTDKPAKTKLRPAIVISNETSNKLDSDILVCPITTKIRDSEFSYPLTDNDVTQQLLPGSEVRCNKIMTIRVWEKQILGKISEANPQALSNIRELVKKVF
jgi:mRNA-degrading endonuclease toxin of MazEF toxin-antitoxin module